MLTSLLTATTVLLAVVLGFWFLRHFLRTREHERANDYYVKQTEREKEKEKRETEDQDRPVVDPSGYIIINLPNVQKTLFMDLLKGFEEYAILKGYNISFSYDGSLPNRVAFRFTIIPGGISVSTEKVKEDVQEYIRKVQNGESFDDVDIVIPPEKHHLTLMVLKNRLHFLQATYTTQRNAMQLYENLIKTFGASAYAVRPQQFFIQGGGQMSSSQYTAVNSQQIAQGQGIRMIGNTASLNLGSTFDEKKELADLFQRVEFALLTEKDDARQQAYKAREFVERAKHEVLDEPQPEESRIRRYLEKAKELFSTATFAKEAVDAFKALCDAIGLF